MTASTAARLSVRTRFSSSIGRALRGCDWGLAASGRPAGGLEMAGIYGPAGLNPASRCARAPSRGTEATTTRNHGSTRQGSQSERSAQGAAQRGTAADKFRCSRTGGPGGPVRGSMPDAFEIADAEVAAAQPPLATTAPCATSHGPPTRGSPSARPGRTSVAEYHYVQRDLRNIVLAVILAALLAVATILVNVTGLI